MGRFVARALVGLIFGVAFGACTSPSDNPFGEGGTSPGGAAGQSGEIAGNAGAHGGAGGFLEPAAGAPDDNAHEAGATGAAGAAMGGADDGGQGATAGQPIAGTSGVAGIGGSAQGGSAGIAGSPSGAGGSLSGAGGAMSGAGGAVSGAPGTSGSAGTGGIAGTGGSAGSGGSTGCVSGPPCAPSNRCHIGILCGLTCVDTQLNVQAGAECGAAQICDANGQCIAPTCVPHPAHLPNCVPEHPCHIGECTTNSGPVFGVPYCTDLAYFLGYAADGTQCGLSPVDVCSAGECVVKNCTADGQPCALGCADASGKVLKDGTPCETGKVCLVGRCIAHLSIARTSQVFAYVAGVPFTQPLAIVTDARLNETSSDLSATISWSDNTTSPGTVSGSSGTFTVSGTHTFTTAGPQQVTVTVVSGPPPGEVVLLTFSIDTVTRSFDLPSSPYAIASGPDGNLWVSAGSLLRVTPAGAITSFPVPPSNSESSITFGSDGNLWLAPPGEVVRVTLAGSVSEFLLPMNDHYVYRIASGPDGNLWFTQNDSTTGTYQAIGRMTTSGVLTELQPFTPGSLPYGITTGADGNLWLTEINAGKVARMTTGGAVTEFALQSTASRPFEIISGPDGNLWVTERGTNSLARITTSGVVTEFPGPVATLFGITAGPDGRVWFAEGGAAKIGAISSTGVVEQFPLPGSGRFPMWITTGADGNLWITDPANQLVRFKP
jgi:streptogramin lyase